MSRFASEVYCKTLILQEFYKDTYKHALHQKELCKAMRKRKVKRRKTPALAPGEINNPMSYLVWTPSVESSFWGRKAMSS